MPVTLLGAAEIRALAAELDVTPTKKLGQNFVVDANTVRKIVTAARVTASDRVVGGDGYGAPAADLLAAAEAVRVPSADELEQLFSDASSRRQNEPVERGDLPGNGDGAPIDEGGEGG